MKELRYLIALFRFAFRHNPLLYAIMGLTAISAAVEIVAMSILLPLATLAAGKSPDATGPIARTIAAFGIPMEGRALLLVFLVLFIFRIGMHLCVQAATIYTGRRILLQMTSMAFSALIRNVDIPEIERKSIGYFITLAGDETGRASALIVFICQLSSVVLLGALYFLAIAVFSPIVALVVVAFMICTFLALFESFRISHRLGARQIEQGQAVSSVFIDALNGLRAVRSFSAENYVVRNHYAELYKYVRTFVIMEFIGQLARLGPALTLLVIGVIAVLSPLGRMSGSVDLPYVVTVIALLMRFFPVMGQALNGALRIVSDARAGQDVTEIIEHYSAPAPVVAAPLGRIDIVEARSLDFSHVAGQPVLKGLDARFERGKSYALIGASGSGKSTFLDLMLGFYMPDSGQLLVNGVPTARIAPTDLRRHVLLFSQDAAIFNDTIANNLRLGLDASDEELEAACRVAEIHDFIIAQQDGYNTKLAYRGTNLSGGQRQRIGIARAVLRKPDVLLLDESTSALDGNTREKIIDNLLALYKDRILVFVTHDTQVMVRVDHVLDMAQINGRARLGNGAGATVGLSSAQ